MSSPGFDPTQAEIRAKNAIAGLGVALPIVVVGGTIAALVIAWRRKSTGAAIIGLIGASLIGLALYGHSVGRQEQQAKADAYFDSLDKSRSPGMPKFGMDRIHEEEKQRRGKK